MRHLLSITIIILISGFTAMGQVTVVGHASAEIIESVQLKNNLQPQINISELDRSFNIGTVNVSANNHQSCTIVVEDAKIFNETSEYNISFNASCQSESNSSNDISLTAFTNQAITKGDYTGAVTVIVAYN